MNDTTNQRARTIGEYRVGVDFNPSGNADVTLLKQKAAELIDLITTVTTGSDNIEVPRLAALAKTAVEEAAMWAVKAVTKPER